MNTLIFSSIEKQSWILIYACVVVFFPEYTVCLVHGSFNLLSTSSLRIPDLTKGFELLGLPT